MYLNCEHDENNYKNCPTDTAGRFKVTENWQYSISHPKL